MSDLPHELARVISNTGKTFRSSLRSYEYMKKLTVGDYIIAYTKIYNDNGASYWVVDSYGKHNKNRKYKIVAVDELGVPFYKKVLFNGKLADEMYYMGNIDHNFTKFNLDPDFQNYILLNPDKSTEDFNPVEA